jgi:UDP-glucose 4-epimerase
MTKSILITGANGFIGVNLSDYLQDMGYEVSCVTRVNADRSLLHRRHNVIGMDYQDEEKLTNLIGNHDIIIHLAALTKARTFDDMYEANVLLTEKLLHIYEKSERPQQFIFLSSQAATGPSTSIHPKKEGEAESPISWYGNSKLVAEKKVKKISKNWTIIRPPSVFGEGDRDFLVYFLMTKYHFSAVLGAEPKYFSLIYIADLVKVIEKCIANPVVYNHVLHVSDNKIYTMKGFVSVLKRVMNKDTITIKIPDKLVLRTASFIEFFSTSSQKTPLLNTQKALELTQDSWLLDSSKAYKLLDLDLPTHLSQSLRNTYLWYLKKKYL